MSKAYTAINVLFVATIIGYRQKPTILEHIPCSNSTHFQDNAI